MTTPARRLRSALFVPAHRHDFRETALASGADGLILDLEDAVPRVERARARAALGSWLESAEGGPALLVRLNALGDDCLEADLEAAVRPGLVAVMVPKVQRGSEIRRVASALTEHEERAGLSPGEVRIWPSLEDAIAVRRAYRLARTSDRIAYMGGAAAMNGDLAHSLGFAWTASFEETLFVRSKVLLDVRAAGVPNPMTGVVTNLHDGSEIETFARQSRAVGYEGMMVIHPRHVAVVNTVFGDTPERVAAARRLLDAWDEAQRDGSGAFDHEGQMVDAAMVRVAREVVARAQEQER